MNNTLNEHPVNKWLKKKQNNKIDFSSLFKLPDILPALKTLPVKDQVNLIDQVLSEIDIHFNTYLKDKNNSYLITQDMACDRINNMIGFYKQILLLDLPHNEVNHWSYYFFNKIDQFYAGQEIVNQLKDNSHFKSCFGKQFKKYGHMITTQNLINISDQVLSYGFEQFKDKINYFTQQFERYGQKIEWSNILEKKPNILIAVLAFKDGYQFKEKELFNIFEETYNYIRNNNSRFDNDNLSLLSETYINILEENKFFTHTLLPQNNMQKALTNFLKKSIVENSPSNAQIFCNNIITYKQFDFVHMNLVVQHNQNLQITGKKFLTVEEQEKVNETIAATKKVVKKSKI